MKYTFQNYRFIFLGLLVALSGVFMAPTDVLGQQDNKVASLRYSFQQVRTIQGASGIRSRSLKEHIQAGLRVLMGLVSIIALAVLIVGGFMYITSAGDPKKAEQAKMLVFYTIGGLLIIGASAVIVNFVLSIF